VGKLSQRLSLNNAASRPGFP